MVLLLDTTTLPVGDRVTAVHDALNSAVLPAHVDVRADAEVRARRWEFGGSISLLHLASSGHRIWRTPADLRAVAPEQVSLAIALSGNQVIAQNGYSSSAVGELQLTDLTSAFDYRAHGGVRSLACYISGERLGLSVDTVRAAVPVLRRSPVYELARRHLLEMVRVADEADAGPLAPSLGDATVAIVGALIASASGGTLGRRFLDDTLYTRAVDYMSRHLGDPDLRPAAIARAHHVSLRHLQYVFAQHEETVWGRLTRDRLDGARRHLATGGPTSITGVAHAFGFTDAGHFARRFRAAYGLSPRDWQRLHQLATRAGTGAPVG